MVVKTLIRHYEASIAIDATWSEEWVPDRNLIVKYCFIAKDDGTVPYKSTITFKLERVDITEDKASVRVLGTTIQNGLLLDWEVDKGQKLAWSLANREGAAITVYVDFIFEER